MIAHVVTATERCVGTEWEVTATATPVDPELYYVSSAVVMTRDLGLARRAAIAAAKEALELRYKELGYK